MRNYPKLQRDVKSYFYKCCAEYNEIDNTTRFIEISTALHNGMNLYDSIVEERNYYNLDQDRIKESLCEFIAVLRYRDIISLETERKETALCLYNNLNFKECVELFSNELMQRFFYIINRDGKIEHFHKYIDCQPFIFLFKQGKISKEQCVERVTHPTGWVKIDKESLIEKNPWKSITPLYLGYNLYDPLKTFALQEDLQIINEYNASKKNPLYHYHLEIPAEPWQGDPLRANIIILSLNPGWEEKYNKDFALSLPKAGVSESIFHEKKNTLLFNVGGFMPENERVRNDFSKLGANYWKKKLETLRSEVSDLDINDFYRHFALIQYCAYTSAKYGGAFKDDVYLHSQLYTKDLIRYIAYNRPNVQFVILRAENKWKELLDSDVWFKILPRTIIAKWPIQQLLNKSNLGEDNYNSLIDIING